MPKKFTYNWKEFTIQAAFKGTPEKLFKMWTDNRKICKWFLTDAKIELKKGGNYYFKWAEGSSENGKVLEVRKNSLFRFTFAGCICEVKFKKSGNHCLVILRQYRIPTDERNKIRLHMGCQMGWTFFFTNLKSVLETGKDLREFDLKRIKEGTVFY
jgi:uncharacterized protein YndB with AHSA1/START domain